MTKGPALSSLLPKANDWSSLHRALAQLDRKAQGDAFELLCRHFLKWHPAYSQLFEEVWLEADIPLQVRRHCNLP